MAQLSNVRETGEGAASARLEAVFDELVGELRALIRRRKIAYAEYHRALEFLAEVGRAGEIPLLLDVFLETTVDEVSHGGRQGTESCLEGPYYVAGAPELARPYVLPQRAAEPGEVLVFSGTVRSTDGRPLEGAELDLWQADATGRYSQFDYPEPRYNLRGRLRTDAQGCFEVRTVVPAAYEIPKTGPTGRLLAALGRHAFRPAHLHAKVTHEGCEPLTTQLYVGGDRWIDSDVVGAVKPSLVANLVKHDSPAVRDVPGGKRSYSTLGYDFTLAPRAGGA
jgi:catechol 1,2-dioxygenase